MVTPIEWLHRQGNVFDRESSDGGIHIIWIPKGYHDRYIESCYGDTIDECYTSIFDNVKQELFNRCK